MADSKRFTFTKPTLRALPRPASGAEWYYDEKYPGLAVRVLGAPTRERVETVREACHIVEEEILKAVENGEMDHAPWQYFAAILPVKSVGVQGDIRAYGETIVVRAVDSIDVMTATATPIPHPVLARISRRITNTLKEKVNRVVYDVTDKPPGTVEWE
jgi:GMP synthase (glutamine-hydrolysing)